MSPDEQESRNIDACASHNSTSGFHPLHGAQVLFDTEFLQAPRALDEVFFDGLDQLLASAVSPVVLIAIWGAAGCKEEVSATAELVVDLSEVAHFEEVGGEVYMKQMYYSV